MLLVPFDADGGRMTTTATLDPARVRRAISLTVTELGDGVFSVVGGAEPHVVERDGGVWSCDCPDSRFNGGQPCKHRFAAHIHTRLDRRVIAALRAAVGAPAS